LSSPQCIYVRAVISSGRLDNQVEKARFLFLESTTKNRLMKYAKERSIAIKAVEKAAVLCQKVFQNLVQGQTVIKKDASPVTVADYGSQALINSVIAQHFPHDPIMGIML
jgi:hypothetical protein